MFGRHKTVIQDICLLSETNSVKDVELEVGILHAENPDTAEAWFLDSRQMCKDEKTKRYVQFVCSTSYKPLKIYRNGHEPIGDIDISVIASQTEDQEMVFVDQGRSKDGRLLWIGICTAMLTLTVCVIALIIFF